MQTFLPFAGFPESAATLDRQRLGKQRVETLQIMKALLEPETCGLARRNHPATRMWRGYEHALLSYQLDVCREWTEVRGYRDTCAQKTVDVFFGSPLSLDSSPLDPPWLGDEAFHRSHREMLLAKDEEHYRPFFPDDVAAVRVEGEPMPYVWPVPADA